MEAKKGLVTKRPSKNQMRKRRDSFKLAANGLLNNFNSLSLNHQEIWKNYYLPQTTVKTNNISTYPKGLLSKERPLNVREILVQNIYGLTLDCACLL